MQKTWDRLGRVMALALGAGLMASCAASEKAAAPAPTSEATVAAEREGELSGQDTRDQATLAKDADAKQMSGLEELVAANSAFAFDLHKTLDGGNSVYSPYSISAALTPVYEGASADTRDEFVSALHLGTMSEGQVAPKFRMLASALAEREKRTDDDRGFRLKISNAMWAANDLNFVGDFQGVAEADYLMETRRLDFKSNPGGARDAINTYVSDSTAGKIADLLPAGMITDLTRVVVTNAVYFNAAWQSPFVRQSTADGDFQTESEAVRVPFMSQTGTFDFVDGDGFKMVEMPYVGGEVAAYVVLPDEGEYASFDTSLSPKKFEWMRSQLGRARVNIKMPKFKIRSKMDLKSTLNGMGIVSAFDETKADFSKMVDGEKIFITDVVHEGFLNVDEAGTEAAAATAVVMGTRSMAITPPEEFHATRPFTFVVVDKPTGTILFVARVMNPAA